MNALASLIRGTGNMLVPSLAVCLAVVLLIPLSPLLIFGWGPMPAFGIAGGGYAVLITSALTTVVLAWYMLAGRAIVRLRRARLQWPMFADILRVGGVGAISTLQTSLTVALTTALVGSFGGPAAVAGYGTGARLEYLLIPLVFGFGAPLVALGRHQHRRRPAAAGAAHRPDRRRACLRRYRGDRHRRRDLAARLARPVRRRPAHARSGRRVPARGRAAYGFFGLGLSLYFASQGAGRLAWPLLGGMVRLVVAVGGGWLALALPVRSPGPSPRWRSASSSTA